MPAHAITISVSTPSTPATTNAEIRARLRHFDQALSDVPGVQAASVTLGSRPMIHDSTLPFWIDGEPKPANLNGMHQALFYLAESGFQHAMGITLLRGRFISPRDDEHAPHVIVIDDAFARAYFPNQNPIGRHIHIALFDVEPEIIGVVGHVKQWGPGGDPRAAIEAQFYYPFMQMPEKLMPLAADITAVVLRTTGDPAAVMEPVRRALASVDPGDVIYAVQTMDDVIATSFAARRLSMLLLGIFAALALALACVGIYSVIAYLVGERTHEIGVRMALGARQADVLRLVLGQGLRMALTGVAIGVAGALPLTHLMTHQLFGITPYDPVTFATAALALLCVAITAAWIPATRATKVDPLIALRRE
jgi:predicted permease